MVQPVVSKKRLTQNGLTLLHVIRKVKDGRLDKVKGLSRISAGKRTENDAFEGYRQNSGGYYGGTHG